jgi:hypothetical protein
MARTDEDIFEVTGTLNFRLSLDWERIEADHVWRQYLMLSEDLGAALEAYLVHYLTRDRLLREMPSTNGPGQVSLQQWERINDGDSNCPVGGTEVSPA